MIGGWLSDGRLIMMMMNDPCLVMLVRERENGEERGEGRGELRRGDCKGL